MEKKNTPLVCLILFLVYFISSCGMDCVNRSGKQVAATRETGDFNRVTVSGGMKVYVRQSAKSSVSIEADEAIMPLIKTQVFDGTLKVSQKNNICNSGEVNVYITAPDFEELKAIGAVEMENGDIIKSGKLKIDLVGASKAKLNIDADQLETESTGASEVNLTGKAKKHEVHMTGACTLKALDFAVADYEVHTSGACKLQVNAAQSLDVHSSGAGVVEYKGKPVQLKNSSSGASELKQLAQK